MIARPEAARVEVGPQLLGRVLDGFGKPMDGGPPIDGGSAVTIFTPRLRARWSGNTSPSRWSPACAPSTACCPSGKASASGIFGGSGVGKSTLLGAMARHNSADVSVIALIGERNREVRDFLENELSPEGLKRSVVVVATSDMPAPLAHPRRLRGAGGRRIFSRLRQERACW